MISGNLKTGVLLSGLGATLNDVAGNVVGPPPNLDPPPGFDSNGDAGVILTDGAADNTIGGETQAEGNIIGANGVGVLADDAGAGNEVLSNGIGAPQAPGPNADELGNAEAGCRCSTRC